jgi:diadenosine tetraphosphate (Ap4A) HIT family hydrolase
MTMSDTLQAAALALPLADPVDTEEPREGEPGGTPCGYCAVSDRDTVWSNEHWQVVPRSWSPIPGGMLLLSRTHTDTLTQMPPTRQAEFGQIAAALEAAILNLGGVARVHLYRYGDGCAHFHAHFVPRPYGRPQFGWRNLPFLEQRLPHPGEDQLALANQAVSTALRSAGLPG